MPVGPCSINVRDCWIVIQEPDQSGQEMALEIGQGEAMGEQGLKGGVRLFRPRLGRWAQQDEGTAAADGAAECAKVIRIKTGMGIQYTGRQGSPEELAALPGGHHRPS